MNKQRIRISFLIILFISLCRPETAAQSLREQFAAPQEEAKPWCFWYWMYGAVTKPALTADLEAMKEAGLGGTYLMPIRSPQQGDGFPGAVEQLTPEFWEMVRYSMEEADRLGLQLGMHICDGFALAGGPWITPEESMQKVIFTDTVVAGGKLTDLLLSRPETVEGYYEDIALLAYPVAAPVDTPVYTMTYENINPKDVEEGKRVITVDENGVIRSSVPSWIQFEYERPFTARNVEIVLKGNNYQSHRLKVMASDDGENFLLVKQLVPARQGWQNTDANSTHAIPPTTARYFRFYWDPAGSEPGSEDLDAAKWSPNLKIDRLLLHSEPRLNAWEGKAGLVWRVAYDTTPGEIGTEDCVKQRDMVDLTSSLQGDLLTATLPQGYWKILRMGHTSTGHTNATAGGGKGLECDKFSAAAVRKQFDHWFGAVFSQTDPVLAHRVLKYLHIDSWECGSQNWSKTFPEEFRKRRGYDLRPWLPLMAGIPVESVERSEEVLRDVRTTIAELVVDVFYEVLATAAREYDCEFSAECVAPTMVSDGLLHHQKVDRPMGEYWLKSPTHDKPNDMLDAISGAHIYGKRLIQAEGFTELRGVWNEHPAMFKTLLDRNYALGINKLFYHVYAHNPYLDRKPGMTLDGIGLFFQRDQTWFSDGGKAFTDYVTRSQVLLQYGVPVVDMAVYTGEEIPRRSILPERLVPFLPGIFGKERVEAEQVRLANVGQPLREEPVGVRHTANMADPDKWVNPLRGYAYDSFNKDALIRLAKVEKGRLVLPGGASYKVLIIPGERPMNPNNVPLSAESQAKIEELRRGGVVIPELPFTADDFSAYGLELDVVVPAGIAWTHRRGAEADVYFISNQLEEKRTIEASFRIEGKKPENWDPVTGEIRREVSYRMEKGRTIVPMELCSGESLFVVFEEDTDVKAVTVKTPKITSVPLEVKEWKVNFPLIDTVITRNELFDWSQETEERISYYSGTATYCTSFKWKNVKADRVYLELGEVADVATVRVNGVDYGIVWTAPYRADVTTALKKGTNTLEIEVTNTWANALNGADQGKAPFEGIWTNAKYRMKEDKLIPAGLLGPVGFTIEK
ncbi:MAG: DNA-binding protein [Bacteroides sp.]|nr:DNA-binding protein [Bacteroides sp.]